VGMSEKLDLLEKYLAALDQQSQDIQQEMQQSQLKLVGVVEKMTFTRGQIDMLKELMVNDDSEAE